MLEKCLPASPPKMLQETHGVSVTAAGPLMQQVSCVLHEPLTYFRLEEIKQKSFFFLTIKHRGWRKLSDWVAF